jgi:hypothetical protein
LSGRLFQRAAVENANLHYPYWCKVMQTADLRKINYNLKHNYHIFICDPTPRNESFCAFEKNEKKGKVKKNFFSILVHDVFCQNRPIAVPIYDNCIPQCSKHAIILMLIVIPSSLKQLLPVIHTVEKCFIYFKSSSQRTSQCIDIPV